MRTGTEPSEHRDLIEGRNAQAAMGGVRWLLDNRDIMPGQLAVVTYRKLYKVTEDEALAEELLAAIREIEPNLPHVNTSLDIDDAGSLRWHNFRPVLVGLLRKKCAGEEYEIDAEVVDEFVERNWERLFLTSMTLSQEIVATYLLEKIGIGPANLRERTISKIRSRRGALDDPREYPYVSYLYALTHIVLTGSGYYQRYLDHPEFKPEIAGFEKALHDFTQIADMTSSEIDVVAEILICLKLLGLPLDSAAELMCARLIRFQNGDGSWGNGGDVSTAKVHTTAVATLALLRFTPVFRPGDIYCDTTTYPR